MAFSRPILIEHELTVTEQELNQYKIFKTNAKDVQNYAKISLELYTHWGPRSEEVMIVINCAFGSDASDAFGPNSSDLLRGTFSFYNNSANFVKHSSNLFYKDGEDCSYDLLVTFDDLLNPEKKFIENGKFTVQMKGMLFCEESDFCICPAGINDPLSLYLWESDDHDFTISVGKKDEPKTEIKVHKCVLACRSSVFKTMLKSGMKESIENKLDIIDFEAEVVQAAVEYMYDQDNFKWIDVKDLISLLQFGDKYDIHMLKDTVEEVLYKRLSPANICEITNASILLNDTELKDACFRFMIIYIKQGIPFDNAETLDAHLASELLKKASMPVDDLFY